MEGISPFSMCLCGFFIPVLALCAYVVFLYLSLPYVPMWFFYSYVAIKS
jgi:hypothetical protein